MNYELSNILFVFPYFIEISKNKILFKFYSRSKTTTITNFILDEIKRSISISVYYDENGQ